VKKCLSKKFVKKCKSIFDTNILFWLTLKYVSKNIPTLEKRLKDDEKKKDLAKE